MVYFLQFQTYIIEHEQEKSSDIKIILYLTAI